jgi:glycosyltransferase involved in cell wall biosynthesis
MLTGGESFKYSIVIPFYNECDNIRPLYNKLVEVMESVGNSFEMVFVDDGSNDASFSTLREIFDHDPRVHLLRLRRNFGQTAALKAGFDFASGEIIISMDGDLQHDPEEIPQFIAKMDEGYDVVSGWRFERTDNWLTRQLPSTTSAQPSRLTATKSSRIFSFMENCIGSSPRLPVAWEQRSWRSPSKTYLDSRESQSMACQELSESSWISSASSFSLIIPLGPFSFLADWV